jgi:hypothetical protein
MDTQQTETIKYESGIISDLCFTPSGLLVYLVMNDGRSINTYNLMTKEATSYPVDYSALTIGMRGNLLRVLSQNNEE